MALFSSLRLEQKEAIGLLQIGTFLSICASRKGAYVK